VNYDNSLVVTITVTCCWWAPFSGDNLFRCGAIFRPPHLRSLRLSWYFRRKNVQWHVMV